MGLSPDEFWRLDLREFLLLAEAWCERKEDDMKVRIWSMAHLMWAAGIPNWKSGTTPGKLLRMLSSAGNGSDEPSPLQLRRQKWIEAHPESIL